MLKILGKDKKWELRVEDNSKNINDFKKGKEKAGIKIYNFRKCVVTNRR